MITACSNAIAQIHHSVKFDSCYIFDRDHPDSVFSVAALFAGEGSFDFYNDSVIVKFSNDEEQGKYTIDLDDVYSQLDKENIIWFYSGIERGEGWECVCVLVIDEYGNPSNVELYSEYVLGEMGNRKPRVSRVYSLIQTNSK